MRRQERNREQRRGAVVVLVAVGMIAIIGFAALAVDINMLVTVDNRLQGATDLCALATANYIANQPGSIEKTELSAQAVSYGMAFMGNNPVANQAIVPEVSTGILTIDQETGRYTNFTASDELFNAVLVKAEMGERCR